MLPQPEEWVEPNGVGQTTSHWVLKAVAGHCWNIIQRMMPPGGKPHMEGFAKAPSMDPKYHFDNISVAENEISGLTIFLEAATSTTG